ncbi:MAG: hypothetical protein U2M67_04160, partial [Methanosarcina sp.]
MGKQKSDRTQKILSIFTVIFFLISITAASVSAQNGETLLPIEPGINETEEVTEPTEEVTEPTEEVTEPTEEVTEPTEEVT